MGKFLAGSDRGCPTLGQHLTAFDQLGSQMIFIGGFVAT
jgi:hypothetical protein